MSAVERFKRALDSVVNELEEERTRPYKKPKLDSAAEQASTNALINKNHLQQHKSNSTEKQVGANALLSKNQELRGEDHSANSVPKQDAMQPSDQIPPQSEVAEKSAKKGRPPTRRTQLSQAQSALKLLQTAHDDLKKELKEFKGQQAEAIKKEVEAGLDWQVVNAIDETQAVLVEDVAKIVRKQVDADLNRLKAETKKTANDLQELRTELNDSETARQKSEKQVSLLISRQDTLAKEHRDDIARIEAGYKDAIAKAKDNHEAAIQKVEADHGVALEKVMADADQAKKTADAKLQQFLEAKVAAEATMISMHEDSKRQILLLKQQMDQLERTRHQCRVAEMEHSRATHQPNRTSSQIMQPSSPEPVDLMDVDEVVYPSPQSEVAQHTPNGWSRSQHSTNCFTSSTSGTTNDVSTHDSKPRQGLMWSSRRNLSPFANSTPSKVSDPENIAMENHSRKGLSGEPSHSGESDEEYPTSNAPRSQASQFQPAAQQVIRSFGRPSVGHLAHLSGQQQQSSYYTPGPSNVPYVPHQQVANILTGAGQSDSRRAPRSTAVEADYSQEHGDGLNGVDQSNSRRAARPSRRQNAPTQWRQTHSDNSNTTDIYGTPRPTPQNTRSRGSRRKNNFDGAPYSDSGYAASPLHNPGSFTQAGPARFNGNAQSPSCHRVSQSHYQDSHRYAPSGSLSGPAQSSSTYPASQFRHQDSFTQADAAPLSGPPQETDYYAQLRFAADNQRNAAHNNLSNPSQGQPQQGQDGRSRGGRGGSRGRGGARNGRGGARNGRGGARNVSTMNSNQPYDADDEYDPRPVMATARQHGAKGAPKPQRNPFSSQSGPSPNNFIPSIGDRFDEIYRAGR